LAPGGTEEGCLIEGR